MSRLAPALLVAALFVVGCAGPSTGLRTAKRAVGLDLWVAPLAKDLDGRPGVDGLSLRLMLQDAATRQPQIAADVDQIELLLFEGEPRQLDDASAFHIWRLTGESMRMFAAKFYGLWCYEITLRWPDRVPATSSVTLMARYRSKKGRVVQSAPSTVSIRKR